MLQQQRRQVAEQTAIPVKIDATQFTNLVVLDTSTVAVVADPFAFETCLDARLEINLQFLVHAVGPLA